jgi:hypothetical protein
MKCFFAFEVSPEEFIVLIGWGLGLGLKDSH